MGVNPRGKLNAVHAEAKYKLTYCAMPGRSNREIPELAVDHQRRQFKLAERTLAFDPEIEKLKSNIRDQTQKVNQIAAKVSEARKAKLLQNYQSRTGIPFKTDTTDLA